MSLHKSATFELHYKQSLRSDELIAYCIMKKGKRIVGGVRYEARSHGRSSLESSDF